MTKETEDPREDPWTYFGSFSDDEIKGATQLLLSEGIVFEVKDDPNWDVTPGGWTGPNALWVDDDYVEKTQSMLIPYFKERDESNE